MEGMEYFYELFEALPRCGPGDNASTRRAFKSIPTLPKQPLILDIGCGTGVQTIELAKISHGKIIALDNHQAFLDKLMETAKVEEVTENIIACPTCKGLFGFTAGYSTTTCFPANWVDFPKASLAFCMASTTSRRYGIMLM